MTLVTMSVYTQLQILWYWKGGGYLGMCDASMNVDRCGKRSFSTRFESKVLNQCFSFSSLQNDQGTQQSKSPKWLVKWIWIKNIWAHTDNARVGIVGINQLLKNLVARSCHQVVEITLLKFHSRENNGISNKKRWMRQERKWNKDMVTI